MRFLFTEMRLTSFWFWMIYHWSKIAAFNCMEILYYWTVNEDHCICYLFSISGVVQVLSCFLETVSDSWLSNETTNMFSQHCCYQEEKSCLSFWKYRFLTFFFVLFCFVQAINKYISLTQNKRFKQNNFLMDLKLTVLITI